jgi:hypothetical protein
MERSSTTPGDDGVALHLGGQFRQRNGSLRAAQAHFHSRFTIQRHRGATFHSHYLTVRLERSSSEFRLLDRICWRYWLQQEVTQGDGSELASSHHKTRRYPTRAMRDTIL